ncbi:flavonol 3-O-glucosyltransferase UGT89B1-like [Pistacia vera]|uniref:flavonol 3-O-glucosyltransferase UGT89B1-like n=1 Tax=Pistacia vera TaxID=55513 RepID=UPI001262C213|nr:flavonol 3-O-glucosyltransferase UGT89B1-like [Pistacia vera]
MASWGIILNTSTHLDGIYIEHLKNQVGHNRVWAVGPLMLPKDDDTAGDLMTWLGAPEDGSVVYVCFGSRGMLTKKQTNELAAGLEKSGVNFIWCVKLQNEKHVARDCGDIPEGFEDRVAGRGYIIKGWAPQVEILRHRAVGVFLTHCGWNSTLEGIAGGVLMLTWPMRAEQFLNARLLVE